MHITVNIIGAGKLGKTLGYLLIHHQLATIKGVCNQTKGSALEAIAFLGQGQPYSIDSLPTVDLTLIAVPDDKIKIIDQQLKNNPNLNSKSIVVHFSGCQSSKLLVGVRRQGCFVASVHPMHSFAEPRLSITQYAGTYCAIEGHIKALNVLKPLLEQLGAKVFKINSNKKALYHAAGVLASNYLVTLFAHAQNCLTQSGLTSILSDDIIMHLMQNTLTNLKKIRRPSQALTGPLQRGDKQTIIQHQNHLPEKTQALYNCLGQSTLELIDLEPTLKQQLSQILQPQESK